LADSDTGERRVTQKHLKKDLKQGMWTVGFGCSWRKTEAAALDAVEWSVECGLCSDGSDEA